MYLYLRRRYTCTRNDTEIRYRRIRAVENEHPDEKSLEHYITLHEMTRRGILNRSHDGTNRCLRVYLERRERSSQISANYFLCAKLISLFYNFDESRDLALVLFDEHRRCWLIVGLIAKDIYTILGARLVAKQVTSNVPQWLAALFILVHYILFILRTSTHDSFVYTARHILI